VGTDLRDRIGELERVIEQQRRFTVRVRTQNAVTRVLAAADRVDEGIARVLEAIGTALDWEIGLFWTMDTGANALRCSQHYVSRDEFLPFVNTSRSYVFSEGVGLPGTVLARRKAVSMSDVQASPNFPRMPVAAEAGLRGALAFPVDVDRKLLGVIEFFTREAVELDEDLLGVMTGIGFHIGQFIARREREQALHLSEQAYRVLAETAPDAIVTITDDGKIVFANSAVSELFGYSSEELVGVDVTKLMPDTAGLARYVESGVKQMPWRNVPLPGLHRNGTELALELSFGEFATAGRRVFTGFIRDVSERRRLERELRAKQEHLMLALEAGHMGTWDWDILSGRVDWSASLERIHGRGSGTFPGTIEAVVEEMHPEDRPHVQAAIERALESGEPYRVVYRITTPHGELRRLEANGRVIYDEARRPVRMIGICTDVSSRRIAV
jgi:PAS domain S-box-containing protein